MEGSLQSLRQGRLVRYDEYPRQYGLRHRLHPLATRSSTAGDTGYSVGGAIVQTIEGYGTELYSQVRWYSLDRDDAPSVDDIVVGTLGTRVKF